MNPLIDANPFPFDTPATYRICVQGRIPTNWADRLEGMTISVEQTPLKVTTTLVGELSDQTALASVLRIIHDLHVPVISVMRVDDETND